LKVPVDSLQEKQEAMHDARYKMHDTGCTMQEALTLFPIPSFLNHEAHEEKDIKSTKMSLLHANFTLSTVN
jgi:hypothetical protein